MPEGCNRLPQRTSDSRGSIATGGPTRRLFSKAAPMQAKNSRQMILSVNLFEPTPHREFFAGGRNRKRRVKPCRTNVTTRIIGEV